MSAHDIKLAINYSPQAAGLLTGDQIQVDYFKCPDWPDLIKEASSYRPIAIHFSLQAGTGTVSLADWDLIGNLLASTPTRYVNLHLEPPAADYPSSPPNRPSPADAKSALECMLSDISAAASHFGSEKVILENSPYHGADSKYLRTAVEPDIIRAILAETNTALLLDIAHARISAYYLGMDEREYISALPLERLRELHFAGLHRLNGRLEDHLDITETDWQVLQWCLERIRLGDWPTPWLLAFEYGGVGQAFAWRSKAEVIVEQLPVLYQLVESV